MSCEGDDALESDLPVTDEPVEHAVLSGPSFVERVPWDAPGA
jgi:hypothetical protein